MAKNNDDNNELPNKCTAKLNKSMNNKDKTNKNPQKGKEKEIEYHK